MAQPAPKDIRLRPDGIHIAWTDDHQSYHEYRALRYECRCAQCINELTGKRMITMSDVRRDVEAMDWLQVGRYALQFLWTDFHTTGLYSYVNLRQLCQCDQCNKERRQASEPANP